MRRYITYNANYRRTIIYVLLFSCCLCSLHVYAIGGKCGDNAKWNLDSKGTLTISGKGNMSDFEIYNSPWIKQSEKIKKVVINDGITRIGNYAFNNCNLQSISIPSSVTSIGINSFFICHELSQIHVEKNNNYYCDVDGVLYSKDMKVIIKYPANKKDLSYTIPDAVTTIGDGAFEDSKFRSFTIPNTITKIGKHAFRYSELERITIPNSIEEIAQGTFEGCFHLTYVTLPKTIKYIGSSAFACCFNLKFITIPDGITNINNETFHFCSKLTSITIPSSVLGIWRGAFSYCEELKTITIPPNVTYLGEEIFKNCDKLEEIHYPQGLDLSNANIPPTTKCIVYDPKSVPAPSNSSTTLESVQPEDNIQITNNFPMLYLVEGSLTFTDSSLNKRIDANEQCMIKFKVKNDGKGIAQKCEARVKLSGAASGISAQTVKLPAIAVGQTHEVSIPVTSDMSTQDGNVTFSIEVYEPNGWGIAPFNMVISTKAYDPPFVHVVDYNVASPSGKIHKMESFTLTFNLQNTQYGDAEDVKVNINLPKDVYIMDGVTELSYPLINSGETKTIKINLVANNNYAGTTIPITIDIKEKYGKYAENKELNIDLVKTAVSTTNITVQEEKSKFRIISSQEMALTITGTPHIGILSNTSVAIMRPEWYSKYNNPQNIKSPFPYAVIQLELKGDKDAIEIAKQVLSLTMNNKHIVEAKDDKDSNTIYFLVHCRNEFIDIDCGDGCEPINIWKERLEPNKVYYGIVQVNIPK